MVNSFEKYFNELLCVFNPWQIIFFFLTFISEQTQSQT